MSTPFARVSLACDAGDRYAAFCAFHPGDGLGVVTDRLRPTFPKLAAMMDDAEHEVQTFMNFPKEHRVKIHSTNVLERRNGEIRRRVDAVGKFPDDASMTSFLQTALRRLTRRVICACLLLASATGQAVIVEGTVSAIGGGMYHYEFSITNDELEDLELVSITDAPIADPIIAPSLLAPAGFLSNYDGGLGIVDWIADGDLFAVGTTIGGFSFNSLSLVPAYFTRFSALDALGNQFRGDIRYTVAPPPAGVPEPATVWLFMLGLSALVLAGDTRVSQALTLARCIRRCGPR